MDIKVIEAYFFYKDSEDKKGITNKKLQKLLYYAQAWYLVFYDSKLFEENIEAWVHGPAICDVYLRYRSFGYYHIDYKLDSALLDQLDDKIKSYLDQVWDVYGKYDADYLELLTHSEKPWQDARAGLDIAEASKRIIDTEEIKNYYKLRFENERL